jgi:hypothetical protein
MNKGQELDSALLRKAAAVGVIFALVSYAIIIISRPTLSPEIGLAFLVLDKMKTLGQALQKFTEFHETWYRPFTFYVTNYLVFHTISIQNIYGIKILSVCLILLNGFVVTLLSKRIFGAGLTERALVFALVVTHPLYYIIALDGSGIVDPFFNIFLNWFLVCFLVLLEGVTSKTGGQPIGNKRRFVLLSCLFILCTITSHERGLAIFAMIGSLSLYYYFDQLKSLKLRPEKATTIVIAFSAIVCFSYLYFVFGAKQQWSGQDYRTVFEWQYIFANLIKGVTLPFWLHLHDMSKGYDVHHELTFNLFAVPFLIALTAYIARVLCGKDARERSGLIIVTLLYLCALPIPVWCGGNSWHFFTAGMYASVLTGRAIFYWLSRTGKSPWPASGLLALIFILLSYSAVRGIHQELPETNTGPMFMIDEALHDPVLGNIPFAPEVVYYDTGSWGSFTWPFGGQSNLFKYLYLRVPSSYLSVSLGFLHLHGQP